MFGRTTATPIVRLDAVSNLEAAVAALLAVTECPPIARSIQFPTAVHLAAASRQSARALPPSYLKAERLTPLLPATWPL
ncbi:MAG: hypothetical protein LAO07_04150 [Acidobacteriia bacterium]|nr:hypothetical protein [Terriglobia bacterium]